jgi:hypothetical protein
MTLLAASRSTTRLPLWRRSWITTCEEANMSYLDHDSRWAEVEQDRYAGWLAEARLAGKKAAEAAASWCVDGNMSQESMLKTLKLLREGDPVVDSYLPPMPTLSGEWADTPTPGSLAYDVTGLESPGGELVSDLADAWEKAVSDNYGIACERELLAATSYEPESYDPATLPPYYDDVRLHHLKVLCQRCGEPLKEDAAEVVDEYGRHWLVDAACMDPGEEMA